MSGSLSRMVIRSSLLMLLISNFATGCKPPYECYVGDAELWQDPKETEEGCEACGRVKYWSKSYYCLEGKKALMEFMDKEYKEKGGCTKDWLGAETCVCHSDLCNKDINGAVKPIASVNCATLAGIAAVPAAVGKKV